MEMNLGMRVGTRALLDRVAAMVRDEIVPMEAAYHAEIGKGDRWTYTARQAEILEGLKTRAKAEGLWNFWLTDSDRGQGLSTVEYAYLAEEMGRTPMAAEVFNCNAPDTGNMEVFERYGTDAMKARWLAPLLEGEIRSAYLMTEPDVASSDATNIAMSCRRDGDDSRDRVRRGTRPRGGTRRLPRRRRPLRRRRSPRFQRRTSPRYPHPGAIPRVPFQARSGPNSSAAPSAGGVPSLSRRCSPLSTPSRWTATVVKFF